MFLEKFNEDHDPSSGQFTGPGGSGGGGSGGSGGGGEKPPKDAKHPGEGYSKNSWVDKKGVIHTSNVYDAQRALFEDRKVELKQLSQVSTLVQRLGETAREMAAHGERAPTFNLCNVSVKGTNLFCAESKGIPRVEMPVIQAKKTKDFIKYLKSEGYGIEKDTVRADHLRATQNEISGEKVAAAVDKINERGFYKRLVVSRDDYILDGHHTWAGQLAIDAADGTLKGDKNVKIARIDISITKLLEEAEKWTGGAGKKPASEAPKTFREIKMPMQPRKDETESDFMSRCVPDMIGTGDNKRPQDQAVAACASMWRDSKKSRGKDRTKAELETDPIDYDNREDFMSDCISEIDDEERCSLVWDEQFEGDMEEEAVKEGCLCHKTHAGQISGLEFILSDETPDRMDDVIRSDGWEITQFKKNPIALFNHRSDFPIGKWSNLRVDNKQLRGHLELAPLGTSERIDEIRRLVDAGILKAVSVGFKPMETKKREGTEWGSVFLRSELVETSLVSVPANPNALSVAKQLKISPETIDMVFAGQGRKVHMRRRGFSGGYAKTIDHNGRTRQMSSLSQRITDLETQINSKRDALSEHIENMDDNNVSNSDLEITGKFNQDIAQLERTREALVDSEKLLVKSASGHERSRALSTVVLSSETKIAAPAVIPAMMKSSIDLVDLIVKSGAIAIKSKSWGTRNFDETRKKIGEQYPVYNDEVIKIASEIVLRAASAPALTTVTGWAAELAQTTYAALMPVLMPQAILTRMAPRGLTLTFGGAGRIVIPTRSRTPSLAGSFVGEGLPIPVRQGAFTSQTLVPKKMAVITTWTKEMDDHSIPAIEGILREAIQQDTSVAIDSILIDANAATAVRPAGLLNGVSATTITAGGGLPALIGDIGNLISAITTNTFGNVRNLVWLANPTDMLRASLTTVTSTGVFPFRDEIRGGTLNNIPIIDSSTIPAKTLILVDVADFVVAGGDAPRMDMSDQATLHMEDTTPLELVASPSTVAAPQRSLFQTDSLALRMVLPLNWILRRTGVVAWVQNVSW